MPLPVSLCVCMTWLARGEAIQIGLCHEGPMVRRADSTAGFHSRPVVPMWQCWRLRLPVPPVLSVAAACGAGAWLQADDAAAAQRVGCVVCVRGPLDRSAMAWAQSVGCRLEGSGQCLGRLRKLLHETGRTG
eukprot:jgi/Ulvmu1/9469/UM052_0038.1